MLNFIYFVARCLPYPSFSVVLCACICLYCMCVYMYRSCMNVLAFYCFLPICSNVICKTIALLIRMLPFRILFRVFAKGESKWLRIHARTYTYTHIYYSKHLLTIAIWMCVWMLLCVTFDSTCGFCISVYAERLTLHS